MERDKLVAPNRNQRVREGGAGLRWTARPWREGHWSGAGEGRAIRGEKKTETEDKDRLFSERYYGRFERRIPLDDIDQDKIDASFKNGVLNVTLPKSPTAQQKVRRIAINGK